MIPTINMIVHNWFAVWSAGSVDEVTQIFQQEIIGTIFLFLPVYLVYGGIAIWGAKIPKVMMKILPYIIGANAMLALMPVLLPVGLAYFIGSRLYRHYHPPARQPAHHPRRRAYGYDEETDEETNH